MIITTVKQLARYSTYHQTGSIIKNKAEIKSKAVRQVFRTMKTSGNAKKQIKHLINSSLNRKPNASINQTYLLRKWIFNRSKTAKAFNSSSVRHILKRMVFNRFATKQIQEIVKKQIEQKPITAQEQEVVSKYEEVLKVQETKNLLTYTFQSSYLLWATYNTITKVATIHMKRGKGAYPFQNVPQSQMLILVENGGEYMWDYFGWAYSPNKNHWVRKAQYGI